MNKPRKEEGDDLICNGNYIKVADIGKDEQEGGVESGKKLKLQKKDKEGRYKEVGGIAIYNILKRHNAEIIVYVEGLAASIASVIAMAGDKIIIPANVMKFWAGVSL